MVYVWLAVTFCVCLVTSNLFVPRLWQVGKWPLQLSGAVVIFPISYIINDLLTEVYGYRKAMRVIWMGFILSAFVALAAQLVCWLPAPIYPESQEVADSFNRLFGLIPLVLFFIWPELKLLGTMGLICLPMGFGDYLLAWLVLRQVPSDAMVYRQYFHTYWY